MAQYTRVQVRTPGITDVIDDILADHEKWLGEQPGPGMPVLYSAVRAAERFLAADPPAQVSERVRPILAGVRPAESLAATLRGGVTDELGFPILEGLPEPSFHYSLEECGGDLYLVNEGRSIFTGVMNQVHSEGFGPGLEVRPFSWSERIWCSECLAAAVEGDENTAECAHEHGEGPERVAEEHVRLPGTSGLLIRRVSWIHLELVDAEGRVLAAHRIGRSGDGGYMAVRDYCHRYAAGTELVPPPGWWRHMRMRDAEGSAALRALDTGLAERLLAAVSEDLGQRIVTTTDRAVPRGSLPERDACIDELTSIVCSFLPTITDERLLKGVTSLVWTAVECRERVSALQGQVESAGVLRQN